MNKSDLQTQLDETTEQLYEARRLAVRMTHFTPLFDHNDAGEVWIVCPFCFSKLDMNDWQKGHTFDCPTEIVKRWAPD